MAIVGEEGFFRKRGRVGEIAVYVGASHRRCVDVAAAVALGGVDEFFPIGAPLHAALGGRSGGDACRGFILHGGDEYIAAVDDGHHLAVRRGGSLGRSAGCGEFLYVGQRLVYERYRHLGRLSALAHSVYLAVVGETQGAVGSMGEKAHGVGGEMCYGRSMTVVGEGIDIHAATVALAEEIVFALAGRRICVLAPAVRYVGVGACACVVAPDVACDARCVVLAPFILKTFHILIKEGEAAGLPADISRRGGEHAGGGASCRRHGIELGHARRREKSAGGGVLYGGREQHGAAVGGESFRYL